MKIMFILLLFIFNISSLAVEAKEINEIEEAQYFKSVEEIIEEAEITLAQQLHISHVALNMKLDKDLLNRSDLKFTDINLIPNSKIAKLVVASPLQEHRIIGSWDEAVLVPMLLEPVKKGEIIENENVAMMKMQIKQKNRYHILDSESLTGKEAKHRLPAYHPIKQMDITEPSIIQKGQQVTLVYNHNILRIRTKAIAMESGAQHQVIKVKNLDTQKILQALVIDAENCEVTQ